jgi:hypothetical protein
MLEYGFIADPNFSTQHSAFICLGDMPIVDYWLWPTKMAFHDLTTSLTLPRNLRTLLGQGLKFIPTPYHTTRPSDLLQDQMGVNHIERSLRLTCFFLAHPPSDVAYNPCMCPTSDWTPPEHFFPKILSHRILQFKIRLHKLFQEPGQVFLNLSLPHRHTLTYLCNQTDFLVINCDKNLGPALIEQDKYIRLAVSDHLSDGNTYQALTADQAAQCQLENASAFQQWLQCYGNFLLANEYHYLREYAHGVTDPYLYFYLTMKIHKKPLKTRPIVAATSTDLVSG